MFVWGMIVGFIIFIFGLIAGDAIATYNRNNDEDYI